MEGGSRFTAKCNRKAQREGVEMDGIAWRESYLTGCAAMDEEHQRLLQLVNRLLAQAGTDAVQRTEIEVGLCELNEGLRAHFAQEEEWMKQLGFANAQEHRQDHQWILAGAKWFSDCQRNGAGGERALQDGVTVFEAYFEKHLMTYDKELADYLAACGKK